MTKEEKIQENMDFYRKWSKDFGEESMLEISCGMIQHLSDRCKELKNWKRIDTAEVDNK